MVKESKYLYIKAIINNSMIFIKLHIAINEFLFDILYDNGYEVLPSNREQWSYYCDKDLGYIINTKDEAEEFKSNNIKYKKIIRNEA